MKNNKKNVAFLTLFVIASFILLSSCNPPTNLQSKWRDKDIVIDGNDNEWQDCRLYADEFTQTDIGIYNDDAYVYVYFSTMDMDIQKEIVRQGFFIWFDEKGGKNKALGVRYPIGGQSVQGDNTYSVSELQILTSEQDTGKTLSVSEVAKLDINVMIGTDESGKLIYELKMPLKYLVPSELNKIGVGVMTVKATGRTISGISGFGGSGVSEIGANIGAASDIMKGGNMSTLMGPVVDYKDRHLVKIYIDRVAAKATKGEPVEIWTNVLLASRP